VSGFFTIRSRIKRVVVSSVIFDDIFPQLLQIVI